MTKSLFAILAFDGPGSADKRAEHREGHLAHFKAHADSIMVSGPLGGVSSGSLVIYEAGSADEARAFINGDPFFVAGVWNDVRVHDFRAGAGHWTVPA